MPDPIPARNYAELPLAQRLEKAHGALLALAEDPDLAAAMEPYGYGPESARVAAGQAAYDAAAAAFANRDAARGEQREATEAFGLAYRTAHAEYQRIGGVARVAFADAPATLDALGLPGYPTRYADRLQRFRQLSAAAREPGRLAALSAYGVTAPTLDAFDALVGPFDDALHEAGHTRSDAQDATDAKGGAMDALDTWVGRMHGIARVALKGRPQLLEKLGLLARS